MPTRYAIAGTGTRARNFADAILTLVSDHAELVALYDLNSRRMEGFRKLIRTEVPSYTDFDRMVAETKPQTLIVCTTDRTHPELVEMATSRGLDVLLEKPMAISEEGVRRIRTAERESGRSVTVTFNMRFAPYSAKVREVLMKKPVGEIRSVSAEWFIDKTHGMEYFHRWHAYMENGGGLFVHKATHHFDLLNWFLDDVPDEVVAQGSLRVYGKAGTMPAKNCRALAFSASRNLAAILRDRTPTGTRNSPRAGFQCRPSEVMPPPVTSMWMWG